jgi:uncharacterized protein
LREKNKEENNVPSNEFDVIHNVKHNRFEVFVASEISELNYHMSGDTIIFTHTGVPSVLEGRGIGSLLVKTGLEYAKKNNLKVETLCWFVEKYIQRHAEYQDLMR